MISGLKKFEKERNLRAVHVEHGGGLNLNEY